MRLRHLAGLLLALPLAAADFPLTAPAYGPAAHSQSLPDVASNGAEVMAVWLDSRSGEGAVFATRLRDDGTAVDEHGIAVATGASTPRIAPDGRDFVVVYNVRGAGDGTTQLARIANGRVSGPPAVIAEGVPIGFETDGHTFCTLVRRGVALTAVFTDRFGELAAAVPLPAQPRAQLAVAGSRFLVASQAATGVRLFEVSPAGIVKTTTIAMKPDGRVAILGAGDRALVASAADTGPAIVLEFAIVDADGNLVAPVTRVDAPPALVDPTLYSGPLLGWDGTEFVLAWEYHDGVPRFPAIRVRPDGTHTAMPALLTASFYSFATAYHRGETVIVSSIYNGRDLDVFAAVVPSFARAESFAGSETIARSAIPQTGPRVAASGVHAFAIWSEDGSPPIVVAAVVAPNQATRRLELSPATALTSKTPAAAGSREQFLAVWAETKTSYQDMRVVARRVDLAGNVRDAVPIELRAPGRPSPSSASIGAASDGANFFVVWMDGWYRDTIMAALVRSDGTAVPQRELVRRVPWTISNVRVVWSGTVHAVFWLETSRVVGAPDRNLRLMRVTARGEVLDHEPLLIAENAARFEASSDDRGHAIVTWYSANCIRALTLTLDGTPSAPRAISCDEKPVAANVTASWNGRGYTFLRQTGTERLAELESATVSERLDPPSRWRRLLRPGTGVLAPTSTPMEQAVFAVYEKLDDDNGGVRRVFGRFIAGE